MTRHTLQGRLIEMRGLVVEYWGRLKARDRDIIAGKRLQLVGMLQRRYRSTRDEAERRVDAFARHILAVP